VCEINNPAHTYYEYLILFTKLDMTILQQHLDGSK
jgi:hypothetical protein